MRILCFGDSLALPREGCNYSETWVAKLKSKYPGFDFICDFRGGMLVKDLYHSWSQYYQYVKADIVIIQEGICDCAPRYVNDNSFFWKIVIKVFEKMKMSTLFWKIMKRGSRKPSCTYTAKNIFENQYDKVLNSMYGGGKICYYC